jgi:hypothetical protein
MEDRRGFALWAKKNSAALPNRTVKPKTKFMS